MLLFINLERLGSITGYIPGKLEFGRIEKFYDYYADILEFKLMLFTILNYLKY